MAVAIFSLNCCKRNKNKEKVNLGNTGNCCIAAKRYVRLFFSKNSFGVTLAQELCLVRESHFY